MERQPAVYILASERNGTIYIGVTSNLVKRSWEHRTNAVSGFTQQYGVHRLVYYELHGRYAWSDYARETVKEMESRLEAGAD